MMMMHVLTKASFAYSYVSRQDSSAHNFKKKLVGMNLTWNGQFDISHFGGIV